MTGRERHLVFGEVADVYDDVRAGYPPDLVDAVLAYAGRPLVRVVEIGAGTGKATAAFLARGVAVTCVEPDARMAAVLRTRFPGTTVVHSRFEDWAGSAGGVDLAYSAQAWHWVDESSRCRLLHDTLAPDGTVALFWNQYMFADAELETAINRAYDRHAPQLRETAPPGPGEVDLPYADELRESGLFAAVRTGVFRMLVRYPTPRYRALLTTFSPHRMLPEGERVALHDAIGAVVDAAGGAVDVDLASALVLARRA